jgi:hypothetical protein
LPPPTPTDHDPLHNLLERRLLAKPADHQNNEFTLLRLVLPPLPDPKSVFHAHYSAEALTIFSADTQVHQEAAVEEAEEVELQEDHCLVRGNGVVVVVVGGARAAEIVE